MRGLKRIKPSHTLAGNMRIGEKSDWGIEVERERNKVTSFDLIQLHKMELEDFKFYGQPGLYSERTEEKINDVASRIIWAVEKEFGEVSKLEKRKEHIEGLHERTYETALYARRISQATTPQEKLRLINEVLHHLHVDGLVARRLVSDMEDLASGEIQSFFEELGAMK